MKKVMLILSTVAIYWNFRVHSASDFEKCQPSNEFHLYQLTLNPNPPVIGQYLDINMIGSIDFDLQSNSYVNIKSKAHGIDIPMIEYQLNEKVNKGNFNISFTVEVPSTFIEDVELQQEWIITNDKKISCFNLDTTFVTSEKEQKINKLFNYWKIQHGVDYKTNEEHSNRLKIFRKNYKYIETHNMNLKNVNDVKLAMNKFGDWTDEEYVSYLSPVLNRSNSTTINRKSYFFRSLIKSVPQSIDWTELGKVTEVKDQGQCGSCWSFSTTGAIESAYAIKYNEIIEFSEQQLVDCSSKYGNYGCNGGLMDYAFQYVMDNGLTTEFNYPYEAIDQKCKLDNTYKSYVNVSNFFDIEQNNELELKKIVAQQPVSVAIEADQKEFQFYSSGILRTTKCGNNLDHGVLLVGYGESEGIKYWKVKNSWGKSWGNNGYILLERTDKKQYTGTCGIAMSASYPVLF